MSFKRILLEDKALGKGIFWIKDLDDIENNKNTCFPYPCDMYGNKTTGEFLLSKSGNNYNHKAVWNELEKNITENKPFDYFPRGRVEIRNGIATIFLNPNIANEKTIKFITNEFNLTKENGIKKIRQCVDNSVHYKCFLDDKK